MYYGTTISDYRSTCSAMEQEIISLKGKLGLTEAYLRESQRKLAAALKKLERLKNAKKRLNQS